MSLDLTIDAKIFEKKTGRIISSEDGWCIGEADEDDKGFFVVCDWRGWVARDIRDELIRICSKYTSSDHSLADFYIPIKHPALREIYAYLLERACPPESESFDEPAWAVRGYYETTNLDNAKKLHDLILLLDSIEHGNTVHLDERFFTDKDSMESSEKDPQGYEWDFRICNSY